MKAKFKVGQLIKIKYILNPSIYEILSVDGDAYNKEYELKKVNTNAIFFSSIK